MSKTNYLETTSFSRNIEVVDAEVLTGEIEHVCPLKLLLKKRKSTKNSKYE
jgi:hypothetical protein